MREWASAGETGSGQGHDANARERRRMRRSRRRRRRGKVCSSKEEEAADADGEEVVKEGMTLTQARAHTHARGLQAPVIVVQMPIVEHFRLLLGVGYL